MTPEEQQNFFDKVQYNSALTHLQRIDNSVKLKAAQERRLHLLRRCLDPEWLVEEIGRVERRIQHEAEEIAIRNILLVQVHNHNPKLEGK